MEATGVRFSYGGHFLLKMKGIRSFCNIINLCISNKGNLVSIPANSSSLALGVLQVLKKKGLVDVFQKDPSRSGSFAFKLFPWAKVQLVSTPSRKVNITCPGLLNRLKTGDQALV